MSRISNKRSSAVLKSSCVVVVTEEIRRMSKKINRKSLDVFKGPVIIFTYEPGTAVGGPAHTFNAK
jgi:hypothetical protein